MRRMWEIVCMKQRIYWWSLSILVDLRRRFRHFHPIYTEIQLKSENKVIRFVLIKSESDSPENKERRNWSD